MFRSRSWRARELCSDFKVLDEWTIPVDVARREFPAFYTVFAATSARPDDPIARALFALRFRIGRALGWDSGPRQSIPGCTETTLAERLTPADAARDRLAELATPDAPVEVRPIYLFDDEALVEIANKTIHAAIHIGWVPAGAAGTIALTILTKSRGRLSDAYLALIWPFRHAVIYPAWFRTLRRAWARHRAHGSAPMTVPS